MACQTNIPDGGGKEPPPVPTLEPAPPGDGAAGDEQAIHAAAAPGARVILVIRPAETTLPELRAVDSQPEAGPLRSVETGVALLRPKLKIMMMTHSHECVRHLGGQAMR